MINNNGGKLESNTSNTISRKVPNIWKLRNIFLNNQRVSKEITREISIYFEMNNENIIYQFVGYNEIEHWVKSSFKNKKNLKSYATLT